MLHVPGRTNTLILAFNDNCEQFPGGRNPTTPHITTSPDDGLSWTNATAMAVAQPGTGVYGTNVVIGLSRGLALFNASLASQTRLIMPAETGTLYSDDHGATWTAVLDRSGTTLDLGGVGQRALGRGQRHST